VTSTSSILRDNSKALYQPWREDAFRADEYVQALAPAEKWMLRTLLQAAFVCSQRPYLPDDDTRLWVLAGCDSRSQWDQHSASVRSLFTPIEIDGQRLLSQKKLVEDWDRMSKVRSARAEAGRKGGLAKSETQAVDEEKENRKEAKQTEEKRSEVREVNSLPMASNSLATVKTGDESASPISSPPSSLISVGSNAAWAQEPTASKPAAVLTTPPSPPATPPAPGLLPAADSASVHNPVAVGAAGGAGGVGDKEKTKDAGQVKTDPAVEHLQGVCFELTEKLPKFADVQSLLARFPVAEIEAAFRDYADNASTDTDFAEKLFFADGGGSAVILARRRRQSDDRD
jgi:hypothetical protein